MQHDVVRNRIYWLVGGALALWLGSMFFTVNEEEYAVVLRFGNPVRVVSDAGLKLKLPLPIDSVARIDKRLMVYDTITTEFLTRDKKNVIAQCYAVWRVTDPEQMLRRLGDRLNAEQKLDEHLNSSLGTAFGQTPFDNLVNTDPEEVQVQALTQSVQKDVNQTVADRDYGIQVVDVRLTKLSYPEATLEEVFKRMRQERKTIAEGFRAEGQSEATKIRSQADLERDQILAKAQEEADAIRGQAEREAAAVYSSSYRASPDFYRFWRKLQALEKVVDEGTTLYMTMDNELFTPLQAAPAAQ